MKTANTNHGRTWLYCIRRQGLSNNGLTDQRTVGTSINWPIYSIFLTRWRHLVIVR